MRPVVTGPSAATRHPAVRGRLAAVTIILALLSGACSSIPEPEVQEPQGRQFIPTVPDSTDDVGLAPSIAIDDQGLPTISYFGFVAQPSEGEIPVARPVGAPFLTTEDGDDAAAVLLSALTSDQIWDRGAIAQPRESPAGLSIAFGPATDPSLARLTPARARGTDLAIAGTDIHATWTVETGVWYGLGPNFEIAPIEETREAGAPSIAVHGSGAPIVAYAVAGTRPEVRVAEREGDGWRITPVASLSACGQGCPPATQVGFLGDEPIVVVADPESGDLIAAHREGAGWATEVVTTGVTGGAALATSGDEATISFLTASGVAVATGRFGSWSVDEVADLKGGSSTDPGSAPPGTGVGVDGQGTIWVSWQDADGVHLASSSENGFQEVQVTGTDGGVAPSVAVTDDGSSVFVAWYDPAEGDLRMGAYAEVTDLLIAAPSPPPQVEVAPGPAGCGEDGQIQLEVTAEGTAFDPQCMVAPANEGFTVTFDNRDPVAVTGPHNVVIATDQEAITTDPIAKSPDSAGPGTETFDVKAIDAGSYFFQCTFHPTTMTGTLVAIEGGGGGGGGGDGGGGG
jgi:plastocyanin